MSLTAGTRLGPYAIQSALGAGGMGEVYRATDTDLARQVAIKVLPETFAHDFERLARFEREAKTLASLNHPNIAQIYGLEKADPSAGSGRAAVRALVMELVEGPTLADRIAQGPIPISEALPIARQIAEALEAAHEQGIIHRDLKPANIKLRPDGVVKVLDFGLAKALEPAGAMSPNRSQSPTITSPAMTGVGVILGTAAYMSPEQAKGRVADKRSDVWAFGCVLYEMLTGKPCFEGEDVADTLAFILTREPDWGALPLDTPPWIGNLLRRCLDKDRRRRVGDIAAALFAIDEAGTAGVAHASFPAIGWRPVPLWQRLTTYGAAVVVAAGIAGGAVWVATRPMPPRVSRLAVTTTPVGALTINGVERDVAIAPDGSRVIYAGNNGRELFVQPLDVLESISLFTGAPRGPFVSPDGQWVGFTDGTSVLKKVAITGGPPVTIATLDGNTRGATWMPDDTIVFATNATATGLQEVPAAGGPATVLTRPDRARGDADHVWPEPLPDGRTVLFTIFPVLGGLEAAQVAALDRQTGAQKVIVRGGSHARYVGTGHLVYVAANTLFAVAFDPATLATRGAPVPVIPEVATTVVSPGGGVGAVIAADGTLAYVRAGGREAGLRTLVWVDRNGRETPITAPPRVYTYPRVSPDGNRLVTRAADQEDDLWLWDTTRLTLTRLTFNPGGDAYPVWTPDGRRLIFSSQREGAQNLFWQAADGTGAVERLTSSPNVQQSTGVSPDGARLIFTETAPGTVEDVMQLELNGTHTVTALAQSPFAERNGIISPDGRWLAYEANDSGQFEIYVRPYPAVNGGRWQVSTGGGTRPLWSRTGQELFYASPAGAIMRVDVERGASWAATTPTTVVKEGYVIPSGFPGRFYDVSSDGQRFLMVKSASDPTAPPPQIVVVQHFDEELKRLVPVN